MADINTPVFRVAFAQVWEPQLYANNQTYNRAQAEQAGLADRLSYSCYALFPKDPSGYPAHLAPELKNNNMSLINGETFKAAQEKFPDLFRQSGGQWPQHLIWPVRDGDTDPSYAGKDGFAGCYFMKLVCPVGKSGTNKPKIVDQNVQDILNKDLFYSGCWARAYGSMYAYDNMSKGVRFTLNGLQLIADDTSFSGGVAASDMFGSVGGAAPAGTPPAGTPMNQPGPVGGAAQQQMQGQQPPSPQMQTPAGAQPQQYGQQPPAQQQMQGQQPQMQGQQPQMQGQQPQMQGQQPQMQGQQPPAQPNMPGTDIG